MTNFEPDYNPLANRAQIFEITIRNSFPEETEESISSDLWSMYFNQFKWLSYRNKILHCRTCRGAYEKYPSELESDEWTTLTSSSYKSINRDNLILILKLHNFSDNHIRACELLNEATDTDYENGSGNTNSCSLAKSVQSTSENSSFNFVSLLLKHNGFNRHTPNMELLRSFDKRHFDKFHNRDVCSEYVIDLCGDGALDSTPYGPRISFFNPWCRYLTRYPWLYLKDDNPGCKYCEQAFKLSLQMSFTKWTSPNMLTETVSQDRPNRTLLQHDRSKNHRIAEDVLVEQKIITPPRSSPQSKVEAMVEEQSLTTQREILFDYWEYPPGFTVDRWDRFTKNYHWLYYRDRLFHCTYCERAYESHRLLMTQTSWTSAQFGSCRIKDVCKARHYFYDHQRSNNHRVARNMLQLDGVISARSSVFGDDDDDDNRLPSDEGEDDDEEDEVFETMRPLSPYEDADNRVLTEKQWQQLCGKYGWLIGAIGKSYGCSVCQGGRQASPITVSLSQWTQGQIPFTKTKYIQLRKSLWCHSITRNHINSTAALATIDQHRNEPCPLVC